MYSNSKSSAVLDEPVAGNPTTRMDPRCRGYANEEPVAVQPTSPGSGAGCRPYTNEEPVAAMQTTGPYDSPSPFC